MKKYQKLEIEGAILDEEQLKAHMEKIAIQHTLKNKSNKSTYPVPQMLENYAKIKNVYNLLNEHIKLEISIHPAGEWILDNFYIIEETVRQIEKEMTIKKYTNFLGIQNGKYAGFARIYVLATEIVAYTDNKIDGENLEKYLQAYQTKKTLNMEEIWNIGLFLQIAIIQNISEICDKIYSSQMQKYKVKNIIERLVEKKEKSELKYNQIAGTKLKSTEFKSMKYPFIEYMSYSLKKYGKKAYGYLNILEEEVEKLGITVSDAIQKEHFATALRKISMANCITSIKKIQRINFLDIFEKINGVEEILNNDPSGIYRNMEYKTKEYYRNTIKEIARKTNMSEIYIAKKTIELCNQEAQGSRERHIGYYLIDEGKKKLYNKLEYKEKLITQQAKAKIYIAVFFILTIIISIIISKSIVKEISKLIITTLLLIIPISEFVNQTIQYILGKVVKPKLIPKMDFFEGIDEKNATFVVIPTIIKSKEKVQELYRKMEVFYLANKSNNLYFALLGDCSESEKKDEEFDKEVVEEGLKQVEKLNCKYSNNKFPIFHFIYRERQYNNNEEKYLGWERKRGLLTQFNEYILKHEKNKFKVNTINQEKLPKIKYVITLDSDTDLVLNTAFELVGAMAHILNRPEVKNGIVVKGHGIMQPRVGVNLDISHKNLFTKIFAGAGGIDNYTNAISDVYQDNFGEGIFTGKGIYDVEVFSNVLKNEIPENTVLSHDLLEGSYLRCGLATDIMLMDGYPTKYAGFTNRLARWTRGDWQITKWLKSKLNMLSKFKIFDNLRRSLFEISIIVLLAWLIYIKMNWLIWGILVIVIYPFLLEMFSLAFSRKEGEKKQKTFTPHIAGFKGAIYRAILTLGCMPYKAYIELESICKTIYRLTITHKHLLEWMTSEEADKQSKTTFANYYKMMFINVVLGIISLIIGIAMNFLLLVGIGILWIITPYIMYKISIIPEKNKKEISKNDEKYLKEIAYKTWQYFKDYLKPENNYLIPDNYQEDRKQIVVPRTSSTNIGLSMLAVISSYDLGFEDLKSTIERLTNIINVVYELSKWNGHLYNWYNIKTKNPLIPKYVSTVDSGNLVGYMYTTYSFLEEIEKIDNNKLSYSKTEIKDLMEKLKEMIENTDFNVLYSEEQRLFSIGYNIEENKLTDSYYDLLASEARQASIVAIAKKDVPQKHWNNLSRTLTVLKKYKGLISWSGTAFEYLMPNINIPRYEGSLLDESCRFLIMNQIEYSQKLGIPWGISEAAFNLKDLHSNYQYKAFGIPWLGLKRGLADEMVVTTYGSVLAITDSPLEVVRNLKILEKQGMYDKYGFYESIDYTPERLSKGKKSEPVKTYMAHHQALILLSINNFFNNQIFQKRFMQNPEIEAVSILLQERMPETFILTKENKEKPEKIKYQDYENYTVREYNKIDERIIRGNVIGNEKYVIAINQNGIGVSKFEENYINRFKRTDDYNQGIFFYIKDIQTNDIWSATGEDNCENFTIQFMPDKNQFEKVKMINKENEEQIKTKLKVTVDANEPVEIRRLEIQNNTQEEKIFEVTSFFEPVLSRKEQDYAHQAFNNLFLVYGYDEENDYLTVKRKKRESNQKELYLIAKMQTNSEKIGETEYEIDRAKFAGRNNFGIPKTIQNSTPLSKRIGLTTEGIVALKNTIKVQPEQKVYVDLILSVEYEEQLAIKNIEKYKVMENVSREFEIVKAKTEAESRYLEIKGKDMDIYQTILSYILFDNPLKNNSKLAYKTYEQKDLWKYGISGDLPIITVTIKYINDIYVVKQIIKAYEFFKTKNVRVELVIIDEENYSYENYIKDEIESAVLNSHLAYMKNIYGGIFVLSKSEMDVQDVNLIKFVSSLVIDSHLGNLQNIIKDMEEDILDKYRVVEDTIETTDEEDITKDIDILNNIQEPKYYNEYGAFSEDGKEYIIRVNKENKISTTWSHIIANEKFGSVVTESGGGYTWHKNSRLNRITSWHNSACSNIPSEIIYLKDEENGRIWTPTAMPMPDNKNYNAIFGFGYAKYVHSSNDIMQELEVFVPQEESCKINILTLKNNAPKKKKLKILYYVKPVIGEDEIKSDSYIKLKYEENSNMIIAKNLYNVDEFNDTIYVSSSEKIKSFTGNKKTFGVNKIRLDNDSGIGKKSCIAIELEVEIESFSDKKISIVLGADENLVSAKDIAYKYSKVQNCNMELGKVKNKWNDLLGRLQVKTPYESLNIMLNGWVMYQTICSRLLAKSGFYQSGGAYGFRDQLQDSYGTKFLDINILYNQIIKHSKHQFIDGDVEHWWHEENNRGIRTKFSDDLLWLPYMVIKYIRHTGNYEILSVVTPYLNGAKLQENEKEKYEQYLPSNMEEDIYEHCKRAINRACGISDKEWSFGENGLPKIGIGDWNDGFSNIGPEGKGESVWLGFFLYEILKEFILIAEYRNDSETVEQYKQIAEQLRTNLNTNAWDGRWFKRAFADNGDVYGSMENEECRIDSIAQSWSVISGAGDEEKQKQAMESLENHLVDIESGIIKLLDPPFEKGNLEPGYIKAYVPGVRENGGQYTHSAIWAIIAEAILGKGDKAVELYKMITPIEHARTKEATNKYKVEPYVISADVYGAQNLAGSGGWTWYTGSSSWYYLAGVQYILGLNIYHNTMSFKPCIPKFWESFGIKYKFGNSIYNISVKNSEAKNTGVSKILVNGVESENKIILDGSGKVFNVEIIM